MFDLEIHSRGFDNTLSSLAAYDSIAMQENRKAMEKSVKLVERYAKQAAPVGAVGELRAKIHGEVRYATAAEVLGVVGSYATHGQVVEEGADPHWPNIRSLALWVLRVVRVNREQLESATFLIARKISRAGLRARPYLAPSFEQAENTIKDFFEKALANIVRRLSR